MNGSLEENSGRRDKRKPAVTLICRIRRGFGETGLLHEV